MKKEATLYRKLKEGMVECVLCGHCCKIAASRYGLCGVRQNIGGELYTHAYGRVVANHVDPIEKKPLYHFFPGSMAYSIACAGCNFKCSFCQNWQISQISNEESGLGSYELKPEEVVDEAKKHICKSIAYTYTEPTVFFEYALDTAKLAKEKGLSNVFVTNGFMSKEALDCVKPYLDAANVDLKFFDENKYKKICQASLKPVLDSISYMKSLNIWVEVTTLVVPGLNDSDKELQDIADFIASVGVDVPWHVSRFHPDYKYTDAEPTSLKILKKAQEKGKNAGLRYVYIGNMLEDNNTYCHNCKELIIPRGYMHATGLNLISGKCPKCKTEASGIF
ncbi:MAG: AmmeMemoRadiSam system radical SAM enzyme [Candidatus Omnitrophota bacterium]